MSGQAALLQTLLEEGVSKQVFPSAQAAVMHQGNWAFRGAAGSARLDTLFDLASLTKVMCTTAVFMSFWAQRRVEPNTPLAGVLPDSPASRAGVTWGDLLYHRSGLPAFVPFFAQAFRAHPELPSVRCPPATRLRVREELEREIRSVRPERGPGQVVVYSDVGFLLLGDALEQLSGLQLDVLHRCHVAETLGLRAAFHRLSAGAERAAAAPTGSTRPREPAPGQEGLWGALPFAPSREGEVDDDNAYAMDGVAGHSGLFANAENVARFGQAVLEDFFGAERIAPKNLWHLALARDPKTPGSIRALGFDTPAEKDGESSAGRFIGAAPPGAVGHLGFTGTSLWIDLARQLVVALNTNRTYLGRSHQAIRAFRPRFHDAVVESLGLR